MAGLLAHGVTILMAARSPDRLGPKNDAAKDRTGSPRLPGVCGIAKGGRFVEEEASCPADRNATPVAFPTCRQTSRDCPMQRVEFGEMPDGEP
jgi:hypothetical protein